MYNTPTTKSLLIVDGCASFQMKKQEFPDNTLNVNHLDMIIEKFLSQQEEDPKGLTRKLYYNATNLQSGNLKFIEKLQAFGWEIYTQEIGDTNSQNRLIWSEQTGDHFGFSASIAFNLGQVSVSKEYDRVFILAHSWGIAPAVQSCVDAGINITIMYISRMLDSRWHRYFRSNNDSKKYISVSFIDLEDHLSILDYNVSYTIPGALPNF